MTSSDLRKFEKHPHSWTFTSAPPPPLGHCPRDVIIRSPSEKLKSTPTLGHSQRGGSNFGPNVKKPTSWPKRGGVRTPWTPPPLWIRHWETIDLRQVTDETFHTYGLCPVRGLNLGRSGVKQSELRRNESGALAHRAIRLLTISLIYLTISLIYLAVNGE